MEKAHSETAPGFDAQRNGVDMLKLLSGLIMQDEANFWVASGLFIAANGVLLVALFSSPYTAVSLTVIGVFGLLLSFAWMISIGYTMNRELFWREKATAIQSLLGIPEELAPWTDVKKRHPLTNRRMLWIVDLIFYLFWGIVIYGAGIVAGLWKPPF